MNNSPELHDSEGNVPRLAESHYSNLVGHDDVIDKLFKPQSPLRHS